MQMNAKNNATQVHHKYETNELGDESCIATGSSPQIPSSGFFQTVLSELVTDLRNQYAC